MKCYMCGTLVDHENVCPHCGSDLKIYRTILASSNTLYNTGLEQAQVRDLSGAIVSLKKSLKYNNTIPRREISWDWYILSWARLSWR